MESVDYRARRRIAGSASLFILTSGIWMGLGRLTTIWSRWFLSYFAVHGTPGDFLHVAVGVQGCTFQVGGCRYGFLSSL